MHFVIVASLYPPAVRGGAEISTQLLAVAIRSAGHKVTVVALHPDEPGTSSDGVEYLPIKMRRVYDFFEDDDESFFRKLVWHIQELMDWRGASEVAAKIEKLRPDFILTQNLAGLGIWTIRKLARIDGSVLIHTVRDYSLLCGRASMVHLGKVTCSWHPLCVARRWIARLGSRKNAHLVGISEFVLDEHLSRGLFKNGQHTVIRNAMPNSFIQDRDMLRLPRDIPVAYLGALTPEKGVETLIRSAPELNLPKGDHLVLAGVGTPEEVERLSQLATSLGTEVEFAGHVRPQQFLPRVATLVVPSVWNEPFGRVILEAASSGCRIVAATSGGIPEAVGLLDSEYRRRWVRMFEPGDPVALNRAYRDLDWSSEPSGQYYPSRTMNEVVQEYVRFAERPDGPNAARQAIID